MKFGYNLIEAYMPRTLGPKAPLLRTKVMLIY